MIPLAKAQKIADRVAAELRPYCARLDVVGSVRRGLPAVNDVDLVLEAADRRALERRVTARCKLEKSGDQYLVARMPDGTQLDLWFSHTPAAVERELFARADSRPDNYGSLLLCRTGSITHNVALRQRAKQLGLHWNPHWGVYDPHGICIASQSEADIYRVLQLPFIEPVQREAATRTDYHRLVHGRVVAANP